MIKKITNRTETQNIAITSRILKKINESNNEIIIQSNGEIVTKDDLMFIKVKFNNLNNHQILTTKLYLPVTLELNASITLKILKL